MSIIELGHWNMSKRKHLIVYQTTETLKKILNQYGKNVLPLDERCIISAQNKQRQSTSLKRNFIFLLCAHWHRPLWVCARRILISNTYSRSYWMQVIKPSKALKRWRKKWDVCKVVKYLALPTKMLLDQQYLALPYRSWMLINQLQHFKWTIRIVNTEATTKQNERKRDRIRVFNQRKQLSYIKAEDSRSTKIYLSRWKLKPHKKCKLHVIIHRNPAQN